MRKMKNAVIGTLLIATLLLTGCGSKSKNENVNPDIGNTETESITEFVTESTKDTEVSTESELVTETETTADSQLPSETPAQSESEVVESEAPAEPQRYVVNQESATEALGTEPFKYGVTKTTYAKRTYNVFNDGTKELAGESSYAQYDFSGYNATDDDLQAEVEALVSANMGYYEEVVCLVNEIRAEVGVAPVELDITLCKAATMRSIEMTYAQYFEHCRADGRSPFTAISYYGFSRIAEGENIGVGQETASYVVERWKGSPGHYQNMIRPNFTHLGVGFCDVPLGTSRQRFWTQLFAQEYVYVEPDWDAYEEWLESQHGQEGQELEEAETEN